jgi:hypothetical protein
MYRCYAWAEDRLSKLDDRCLLCGLDHEPATEYPPTIRQIVVVVPEGEADDEIGPAGWVDEMELWERRREKP